MISTDRIAILGLGGGAGRIAVTIAGTDSYSPLDIAVADTDANDMPKTGGITRIALGKEWTQGQGCGGDAVLGERAASTSVAELRRFLAGARLTVVIAALGKGTGSGAAKVVARLVKEAEVTTLFLVTLPFAFEGNWRRQEAEKCLALLRELVDTVIVVPNDTLFTSLPANTSAAEAFRLADSLMAKGIAGLARITSAQGLVTADPATLRGLLRHRRATCTLGVGHGTGDARWQNAVDAFFDCPLVGGRESLADIDAGVVTLLGGNDLSIGEMQAQLIAFQQNFRPDARLIVGAYVDERLLGQLQITGLLCRYQDTGAGQGSATGSEADTKKTREKKRKAAKAGAQELQQELPLQEQALGIFSGTTPTTVAGENLDIPTFQRRGVQLDVGD